MDEVEPPERRYPVRIRQEPIRLGLDSQNCTDHTRDVDILLTILL